MWQGGHYDVGPLGPTPAQAGMLLRRGWFGRLREGFVPNVEMFLDPCKVGGSLTFRHYAECRNEGLGEEWAFITAHYDVVPNVEMRWVTL